jgi:hypothetical protein
VAGGFLEILPAAKLGVNELPPYFLLGDLNVDFTPTTE